MGDMIDGFKALNEDHKERRRRLGVSCPGCPKVQPKRVPTLLLPGQRCKVCGYCDPRPREVQS